MTAQSRADKAEIAETDIAERFSQSEVAAYIADMAKELRLCPNRRVWRA